MDGVKFDLRNMNAKRWRTRKTVGICCEGSQGQTSEAVVLKKNKSVMSTLLGTLHQLLLIRAPWNIIRGSARNHGINT
jgi:hypothetical protein